MLDTKVKVFHEMTLKLYFMKCSERKISQSVSFLLEISQNSFLIKLQASNLQLY